MTAEITLLDVREHILVRADFTINFTASVILLPLCVAEPGVFHHTERDIR